jgi:predicted TIM-barrel fold metal-dependent hydrolase
MFIIDSHVHLGVCKIFCVDISIEYLLKKMDENEVQTSIIQPLPGNPDPIAAHKKVAELSEKYPGRIYGFTCFNPYIEEDDFIKKARWAIGELNFKGIKIHTNGYGISPIHPESDKIFSIANEFKVPVMVHSGAGLPNSLPSLCIPRAREYPELPIIIAHAGAGLFTSEAIIAAKECNNIYLEASWTYSYDIKQMVDQIGSDRIMFGSDIPDNIGVELYKFKNAGLKQKQLEDCLCNTAKKLFNI